MKHLKLYENFLFELKKNELGRISILKDISQLPKIGTPADKTKFTRDGLVSLDWDKIVFVRSSNELPTVSGKNLICHTGRALKTVGLNKSFEDYLKKKYQDDLNNPETQFLKDDPDYKDFESFKKSMLDAHHARWTKHYTLNHVVTGHMSGNWTGQKYIYLTPGDEMIKVNGKPASLYSIDTYWDKSIVLTDNTVILFNPNVKKEVEEFVNNIKDIRNFIYFLEINPKLGESGDLIDANKAIEQMGYSVFEGGSHYSVEDNLDYEISDLKDKEKIKMSGLHWGRKYSDFEKGGSGSIEDEIFINSPDISYEDYYNFNDKIVKREEKDYLSHRGFMKELLEKFKNEKILESFETIMINITNIARCICTPKYGFYRFDKGHGFFYSDSFESKINLKGWDIKNLIPRLKEEEEKSKNSAELNKSSYPDAESEQKYKDSIHGSEQKYVYFNKYFLNDLKKMVTEIPFYKSIYENRQNLFRLSELVEKSEFTDKESEEIEKLMDSSGIKNLYKEIEGNDDRYSIYEFPTFLKNFKNWNDGAKKYGFKDFFDMFAIK